MNYKIFEIITNVMRAM